MKRKDPDAEIVLLSCPTCGHEFRFVGDEPVDRETNVSCPNSPESCDNGGASEYGAWVVRVIAEIYPNKMVFFRQEDADGYLKEIKNENE